jgi:hypothetical protein
MRRVNWVRIEVSAGGHVVCEANGVGHRLPTTHRIALATATALAASGIPTVVRSSPASVTAEPMAS